MASIPPEIRVVRAFALDAAKHLGIKRKYPGIVALPDRWSAWWIGGVLSGLRQIRREKPSVIWSTYPISTAHLIGLTLSRLSGLPWVADFRDPMINGDYPSNPLQRRVWQWLEGQVFRYAKRCVFTTERAAETYRQRYPGAAEKCRVIENGYDEEVFAGNVAKRDGVSEGQLLMLHSGIIYPRDRNPTAFFQAIAQSINNYSIERSRLKIRFRAPHHGDEVAQLAATFGLSDIVEIAPPIPYREAISEMLGADLLLVFQGKQFNAQIPAKIYEYLRTGKPILGLVDPQGDTARILEEFDAYIGANIDSAVEIEHCLELFMERSSSFDFKSKERARASTAFRFSRGSQAVELASCFQELMSE
ncbi:glycosyltransferase [Dechloromonas sp. ARDL1]|uniref:glycosyltransferase n=1 Tax=Dechloromonas sp. ARDL1 TaxID=3322121 RepID=UPI003DA7413C